MKRLSIALLILLLAPLAVVACDRESTAAIAEDRGLQPTDSAVPRPGIVPTPAPAPTPTPAPAPGFPRDAAGEGDASPVLLQTVQRQVISTASLSMEVEAVQPAVSQIRTIAEGLGGFVEQLSSSTSDTTERANITLRVPQDQFFTAIERVQELGEVQSQNLGSEDVTSQFIDLEARLSSAERKEQSLLSLLEKADQVSDVLAIERELSRVRTEIEQLQGQLNFLERRVALATISISLFTPRADAEVPPSGSLAIAVSNVGRRADDVKSLVSNVKGEVDRVFFTVRDGKERAEMTARVFPADFSRVLSSVESMGTIVSKELQEGTTSKDAPAPEDPNALLSVVFTEKEGSNTGLIVAITAPIGGILLALVLGLLFYLTYRFGRKRASS